MRRIAEIPSKLPLRWLAFASVVANVAVVGTGGAVRLTDSGLGCPTWPRCTDESYVTNSAMGIHGAIEFGNRMLFFVIGLIAVAAFVAALGRRPLRRSLIVLALAPFLGIVAQAVIGGITVLTNLNPWVVGLHFLASMGVIAAAYAFWWRTAPPEPAGLVPAPLPALVWLTTAVSALVLVLGTFVTGSGPHAGDVDAHRNGLDPETIAQVHADVVFLLIGLSVALWFALRAVGATAAARAAAVLVAVELGQGLIGFVQYFTHLPEILVGAHMVGACLVWLATLAVLARTRPARIPLQATPPAPAPATATPTPVDLGQIPVS
ncbi:COX15/CtaA family protein [Micromonospora sp. NPDC049559]|uniref:COX15/CtaA family protein n=1 Tax=Micromonospora sp. NPDC049559 TaxID=3155923 RepID=UPI0034221374